MGTHPIFESDFDCLTEKMRFTRLCLERVIKTGTAPSEALLNKYPGYYKQGYYALDHEIQSLEDSLQKQRAPLTSYDSSANRELLKEAAALIEAGKEHVRLAIHRQTYIQEEHQKLITEAEVASGINKIDTTETNVSDQQLELA